MFWTLDLASKLSDAPWPATKEELVEYAEREGLPKVVIDNLQELEAEDGFEYEDITEVWPDIPTSDYEMGWNGDEY